MTVCFEFFKYKIIKQLLNSVFAQYEELPTLVESDIFITYFIPIFSLFSPNFSVFFQKYDYFITIYQISSNSI